METIVKIKGIDVKYDINELNQKIWDMQYDEEEYASISEDECGSQFSMTLEKFNEERNILAEKIVDLDNTIVDLFNAGVHITKAGKPAKNRKNVLIGSDIITSYSAHYGSHQYYAICLVAVDCDTYIKIKLTEVQFQESF
jgi:hypothetical protein